VPEFCLALVMSNVHKKKERNTGLGSGTRVGNHTTIGGSDKKFWLAACIAALAIFAAYSNHFHNSFHFDDSHAVIDNAYIRDLHNVPRYFTDATTFSSLPANQTWRPIVSISLALDYHMGHGLQPVWFHISTFFWFLVQLILMFMMYRSLLDLTAPRPANRYIALLTVTWYGLHPSTAETVNYIVQRADLYATLGVVAGLVMYIRLPKLRRIGLYLLPVILGALSKAPAVVFGAILLIYIFLFEEDGQWDRIWNAILRSIPALLVCGILAVLCVKMTAKSYVGAGMPSVMYWATQPFVLLRYVRSMLLPFWLSADSDFEPFHGFSNPLAMVGVAGCALMLWLGILCMRRREHRPIAFGIFWFFCASAPTSFFVLAEVENDHRMFFPFVGLMLSVTWALALLFFRYVAQHPGRRPEIATVVQAIAVCLLIAYGVGAWERNEVWASESSLWKDVVIKSPKNGRGLMNYGLTLMDAGDAQDAHEYFQRALAFTPNYYVLEINLGIDDGLLNRNQEAEAHFRRALALAPKEAWPQFYYGRWLKSQGRIPESIAAEKLAIQKNPAWMEPRYVLMEIYQEQSQWGSLRDLARQTLQISPTDLASKQYLAGSQAGENQVTMAERLAQAEPTPEHYLNLSLLYHQDGRYEDCIRAAQHAISLKPGYAEAYNNIAAAYQSMHQWDQAIAAAQEALKLKPDFQLAKNNLAYSLSEKKSNSH